MPQVTEPLDKIMSGVGAAAPSSDNTNSAPAAAETTGRTTTPQAPVRDDHGRFSGGERRQAEQQAPQQQSSETDSSQGGQGDGMVPQQALHAARQAEREAREAIASERAVREALERQVTALMQRMPPQAPAEAPKPSDFWEDPNRAFDDRIQQAVQPLQNGQQQVIERFSKMMAAKDYGADAVNAAYRDFEARVKRDPQGNRWIWQRIMAAEHPYGELVKWHREQAHLSKAGDDPEAYINAEVERRMAERAGGAAETQPAAPGQPQLPSSFTQARNAGPRSAPTFSGPKPLSAIMGR